MLTAKTQMADRVTGLRLVVDNDLGKQFNPAKLLARIEALLRRVLEQDRIAARSFRFTGRRGRFQRKEAVTTLAGVRG